jgi:hypothetical protein
VYYIIASRDVQTTVAKAKIANHSSNDDARANDDDAFGSDHKNDHNCMDDNKNTVEELDDSQDLLQRQSLVVENTMRIRLLD